MEGRMSKELDEKWRELVAAGKAKWMPGMLTLEEVVPPAITLGWDAARVLHADEGDAVQVCTVLGKVRDIHDTALPDFSDPATLGALLGQVREAWGDPYVYAMRLNVRRQIWVVHVPSDRHNIHGEGGTEAAALVAAREAAP